MVELLDPDGDRRLAVPRIEARRIGRICWVAWTVDDYGAKGPKRYGLTEEHARARAAGM